MKKTLIFIPILFLLTLSAFNANNVFASSCTTYGNTTMCDDGTSYTQYGNTIMGSDGTSYTRYGNTTMGSNGSSYTQYGNTLMGSNGTTYTQYGNSIMGSDGSSYQTYGNTTMGSGGGNTYSTCPANSSANSSGKCSCNYGYSVNSSKTACVYTGTTYTAPTTPTCPINSYYDGVSSCKCNYGYTVSGSSCVTVTQSCQNQYGYGSYGSGSSCYCSTGYQWNSSKTSCVFTPPTQPSSATNITSSPPSIAGDGSLCYCAKNYKWNTAINSCVFGSPFFTRYLSIGSTGSEVVNLKNLLAIKGLYTGYVSTAYDKDTETAVSLFQALSNISPTGTVGPKTRAALNK
ncbi:MAG: peptidoglycan-binding domain-containing protein [Candidatus Taylorbacteria bacterium]|nr:peptidoglycan-binding domain-containing protein [Candidatus Taylorbacteria bacterium]